MDVTWGVTSCFVPTRGTDMENIGKTKKQRDTDDTLTARHDQGLEKEGDGNEGDTFNPFARTAKVMRTPTKGQRARTDSCPDLKPSCNLREQEERDKRKREELDSASPAIETEKTAERENRADDEVFVVDGSPSPETSRKPKRKKEMGYLMSNVAGVQIGETEDESALTNGLIQLMQKLENSTSELKWQTSKHVNTKVEIKKLARDIDMMSQLLAKKIHKYVKIVGRKLRKSSDNEDAPGTEVPRTTRAETHDEASQTDPPKPRGEGAKKMTEAVTDEDVIEAAGKKWQEGWFEATTVKTGNPWNSTGEEDFAILVPEGEDSMESGIARLLKDRFPEIGKIEGSGSMKVTYTVQVGTEDPVIRNRVIHKVVLRGTTDPGLLTALRKLSELALQGSRTVAVPVPSGTEEQKFRKLTDLVFRKEKMKMIIHVPQRKGGKGKTPPNAMPSTGEINRPRRDRDTEVLLIKQGDKTYGEMVKGLRTMVGAKHEVKALKSVRKTQDGRLLLAFKRGESGMEDLKNQIKATWQGAEVSGGGNGDRNKHTIHIKGLDVAVDNDDIWEALHEIVPSLQREDVDIGDRRPMFGGNAAVTVRVSSREVRKLTTRGKIKIGFNTCTIEERLTVTKCFQCWEFGHIAKNCRGPDRRALSNGCGQEGHLAVVCKNAAHCLLCDVAGHRGGSGSCPKFKEALSAIRASREMVIQ